VERGWRDALLHAIIPPIDSPELPGLGELDLSTFWAIVEGEAPRLLRFGLRVAVFLLTFAPIVLLMKPRLFTGLNAAEQDRMINRAATSGSYVLRQLVTTLKTFACLAYLRDPVIRRRVSGLSEPP
jgi:hypothetical protein